KQVFPPPRRTSPTQAASPPRGSLFFAHWTDMRRGCLPVQLGFVRRTLCDITARASATLQLSEISPARVGIHVFCDCQLNRRCSKSKETCRTCSAETPNRPSNDKLLLWSVVT